VSGDTRQERLLRLKDGREICYIRWKERGTHLVLLFHGTPGSRLFCPPGKELLDRFDIDSVTVDGSAIEPNHRRPS
jgi:hypothetical protein